MFRRKSRSLPASGEAKTAENVRLFVLSIALLAIVIVVAPWVSLYIVNHWQVPYLDWLFRALSSWVGRIVSLLVLGWLALTIWRIERR